VSDPFYQKLGELTEQMARDFTDPGHECGSPRIAVYAPQHVDSNFPWLYIKFEYEGPLSLRSLKEIEKRYQAFTALEGGSLESINLNRSGLGFVVKLVYVPGKTKAPAVKQEPLDHENGGGI